MIKQGIYLIRYRYGDECYVGQSNNIEARWKKHERVLLSDDSPGWVQNAPSRNPSDYSFEILEEIEDVNARAVAEAKWEEHFFKKGFKLLNAAPTGNVAPDGQGKPVVNLDTGQTFVSAAEAGRSVGLTAATISTAARLVRVAGGHRWAFEGDAENQLTRYFQSTRGEPVGRPFPREGTSAHRIWGKCIEMNNPDNKALIEALPDEKPSQIRAEARGCRIAHGWVSPHASKRDSI